MKKSNLIGLVAMLVATVFAIFVSSCVATKEAEKNAAIEAEKEEAAAKGTLLHGEGDGYQEVVKADVLVGEDGKIISVEITREDKGNTMPDIGEEAVQKMPPLYVGLSTEDEIKGVDTISGATRTSKGIRKAVINALNSNK